MELFFGGQWSHGELVLDSWCVVHGARLCIAFVHLCAMLLHFSVSTTCGAAVQSSMTLPAPWNQHHAVSPVLISEALFLAGCWLTR